MSALVAARRALWVVSVTMLLGRLGTNVASAQAPRASVSSAVYVRSDTNDTTVWAPRVDISGRVNDAVSLSGMYAVDAWTSASVDIVTAATSPVHEVRHEIDGSAAYEHDDISLSATYRYSTENDYWSHGAVLRAALDLAQHNTTFALALFGSRDVVGRVNDPLSHERQYNLGARLSWVQVLDTKSWLQLSWETAMVYGYQAGPYRFVAIGGQGTCKSLAPTCVPEYVPDRRVRNALVANVRRALAKRWSMGLEYRYYFDSWRLQSQTLAPSLAWLLTERATLSLLYRYYTQGEAAFYRERYLRPAQSHGYVTRDRELSALYSHRLGLEYSQDLLPTSAAWRVYAAARMSLTRFRYLAFVGLSRVDALEATLLFGVEMR